MDKLVAHHIQTSHARYRKTLNVKTRLRIDKAKSLKLAKNISNKQESTKKSVHKIASELWTAIRKVARNSEAKSNAKSKAVLNTWKRDSGTIFHILH